jgi:hypothetical protein
MYTWLKKCVDCKSAPYFTNTISDFLIENKKCLFTVVNACICLSYMSGFDSTYSLFNITSSLFHLWRMLSTQSEHHRFPPTAVPLDNKECPVQGGQFKHDVHSCAHARTLFKFWTAIFVKYDILTEYLTLFWFAMLVNEYKLYVSIQKSSKDAKFGQC